MYMIVTLQKQSNRKSVKKDIMSGYDSREKAAADIEKIKNRLYMQLMQKYGIVCPYTEAAEDGVINYVVKTALSFDPDFYYKFLIIEA